MGWESRDYASPEDPGWFRARIVRFFQGDFFNWGLKLYRAWGIEVRLHLLFILVALGQIFQGLVKDQASIRYWAMGFASLFGLVLLHEYGHCIACRRVGGSADRIVLWPLGGLARCAPPHNWRADLITTIGGPAVNLILMPVFAGLLLAAGVEWGAVVFNPFSASVVLTGLTLRDGTTPDWLNWLWLTHSTNAALFFFNVLLPMYPMDSARMVQALMWRRLGHQRATDIIIKIGLAVAILMLVLAGSFRNVWAMELAVFGAICCWQERRQLQMLQSDPALVGYDFDRGNAGMPGAADESRPSSRSERAKERQRKKDQADQAELDRILAKIATSGMSSLSKSEKRWLERATERRRQV